MKKNNLVITMVGFTDNNDWNQSNHYELNLKGAIGNVPFSIHIVSAGQCGEYLDAELEGVGWLIRDSLYGGEPQENWNLSSSFSSLINEFIQFVDEVSERPWKWA